MLAFPFLTDKAIWKAVTRSGSGSFRRLPIMLRRFVPGLRHPLLSLVHLRPLPGSVAAERFFSSSMYHRDYILSGETENSETDSTSAIKVGSFSQLGFVETVETVGTAEITETCETVETEVTTDRSESNGTSEASNNSNMRETGNSSVSSASAEPPVPPEPQDPNAKPQTTKGNRKVYTVKDLGDPSEYREVILAAAKVDSDSATAKNSDDLEFLFTCTGTARFTREELQQLGVLWKLLMSVQEKAEGSETPDDSAQTFSTALALNSDLVHSEGFWLNTLFMFAFSLKDAQWQSRVELLGRVATELGVWQTFYTSALEVLLFRFPERVYAFVDKFGPPRLSGEQLVEVTEVAMASEHPLARAAWEKTVFEAEHHIHRSFDLLVERYLDVAPRLANSWAFYTIQKGKIPSNADNLERLFRNSMQMRHINVFGRLINTVAQLPSWLYTGRITRIVSEGMIVFTPSSAWEEHPNDPVGAYIAGTKGRLGSDDSTALLRLMQGGSRRQKDAEKRLAQFAKETEAAGMREKLATSFLRLTRASVRNVMRRWVSEGEFARCRILCSVVDAELAEEVSTDPVDVEAEYLRVLVKAVMQYPNLGEEAEREMEWLASVAQPSLEGLRLRVQHQCQTGKLREALRTFRKMIVAFRDAGSPDGRAESAMHHAATTIGTFLVQRGPIFLDRIAAPPQGGKYSPRQEMERMDQLSLQKWCSALRVRHTKEFNEDLVQDIIGLFVGSEGESTNAEATATEGLTDAFSDISDTLYTQNPSGIAESPTAVAAADEAFIIDSELAQETQVEEATALEYKRRYKPEEVEAQHAVDRQTLLFIQQCAQNHIYVNYMVWRLMLLRVLFLQDFRVISQFVRCILRVLKAEARDHGTPWSTMVEKKASYVFTPYIMHRMVRMSIYKPPNGPWEVYELLRWIQDNGVPVITDRVIREGRKSIKEIYRQHERYHKFMRFRKIQPDVLLKKIGEALWPEDKRYGAN